MNQKRKYQSLIHIFILFILIPFSCVSQKDNSFADPDLKESASSRLIYRNPRVYNIQYTFELCPEQDSIDRSKDLKLWIPVPRDWDSQKAVKIISVEPEPHSTYMDPELGNQIYFWDFGKLPAKESYEVKIRYRVEVFEVFSEIDPERVGSYDKNSEDYRFYTASTHTTNVNPEIIELARSALGDETNPYLQAKRIYEFVRKKMRFKDARRERGSSIESILNFKVTDPKTGEQYFEGQCDHYSILFVALCRAAGIPARGVLGMVGWGPWIKETDSALIDNRHTMLTSDGLAATRIYGAMDGHIWAEFDIPGYGWIPADPTWGTFGHQSNIKLILSKGRDIKLGPFAPQEESEGYGDQWIPLHKGRVNAIGWGVWNIAKIRVARAKILHTSDPFPADGYAEYAQSLYPEDNTEEKSSSWRKDIILSFFNARREGLEKGDLFKINPRLIPSREAFVCHVLRQIVGDEKFANIFNAWLDLRLATGKPVSSEKFQEIAEEIYGGSLDFFFKEWIGNNSLPQFKLDNVMADKEGDRWRVYGSLLQEGNTYYHIPVDLVLETEEGEERQKIWLDSYQKDFEFSTLRQPEKLIVDPDFHVPTIRWMPPRLQMLWEFYPGMIVVYGSKDENDANKEAARRFNEEFLGLDPGIIQADTDVTADDLKKRCVVLFGRPEINKIAHQFRESFPIKFGKNSFAWQGHTYDRSGHGVVQIIANPLNPQGVIILYAGLSRDATQNILDKAEWQKQLNGGFLIDVNSSYVIFENHTKLASGDWEDLNSSLVWKFR